MYAVYKHKKKSKSIEKNPFLSAFCLGNPCHPRPIRPDIDRNSIKICESAVKPTQAFALVTIQKTQFQKLKDS